MPGGGCSGVDPHGLLGRRSDGHAGEERTQVFKAFDTRSGAITPLGTRPDELWVYGWSPDRTKVLYASGLSGAIRIGVMNADFTGQQEISQPGVNAWFPSWQPAP